MKDLKISKELIKNVLTKETEYLSDDFTFSPEDNYILFVDEGESQFEVNLDTFARLCKEWAYSTYGIMIQSYPYCGKGRADAIKGLEVDEVFKENTEPEAVFKACEWILNKVNK